MKTHKLDWHNDNDGNMIFYNATVFVNDLLELVKSKADMETFELGLGRAADFVEMDISDRDGEEVLVENDEYEALCFEALNQFWKRTPTIN